MLVPRSTGPAADVLVAVRGKVGVDRLARVVAGLFGETDASVTLFHVAKPGQSTADAQTVLDGVVSQLTDAGMDDSRVTSEVVSGKEPLDVLADVSTEYDTVVMGESDPSLVVRVRVAQRAGDQPIPQTGVRGTARRDVGGS